MPEDFKPFPVTDKPRTAQQSVLLARLVHEIANDPKGSRERSQRTLQVDLVRSSRNGIDNALASLCDEGWLRVLPNRLPGGGNRYGFGNRLKSRPVRAGWEEIAHRLFGPGGYLEGTLADPLFAYGSLGAPKLLVLAVVGRHNHQLRKVDLERALEGIFSRDSTKHGLKELTSGGFLETVDKRLAVPSDIAARLDKERGRFVPRLHRIRARVQTEQDNYLIATGTSKTLVGLRKHFRGSPCVRCGRPSEAVEHFPPKKWFGEDDWFLTFPICTPCNQHTVDLIKRHAAPARKRVRRVFRVVPDPERSLEERIRALRDRFYRYVDEGRDSAALEAAAKARAIFDAHTGEMGVLVLQISDDEELVLVPGEEIFPRFRRVRGKVGQPLSAEKPDPEPGLTRVPVSDRDRLG